MKSRGFTLMEMVMTIVIGSVITIGIASYIRIGMTGYADTVKRQQLQTQAQFVIEKLSREIRHAVPNSFEITQNNRCLSFFPVAMAGFYNRQGANNLEFIVGNLDASGNSYSTIPSGLRMIINPTHFNDLYNSDDKMDVGGLAQSGGVFTITNTSPFNRDSAFNRDSVGERFYLFNPQMGVRYCWDPATQLLVRGNIATDAHDESDITNQSTVAANLSDVSFEYESHSLHSGGLIHINLNFEQSGESSVYQQDVQVLNVP